MIALEIFLIIGKLCQLEKHKHMTYNFIKLLPFEECGILNKGTI